MAEQTAVIDPLEAESIDLAGSASLSEKNLTAEDSTVGGGAVSGRNLGRFIGRQLLCPASTANLKRQSRAQFLLCSFSAIWLLYIVAINYTASAIAWSVALTCMMLWSLVRLLHLNQEIKFRLVAPSYSGSIVQNGKFEKDENEKAEIDIAELAAITLVVSSAVLGAVAVLIQYKLIEVHEPIVKRQVVDIELISPHDVLDNQDLLPSTSAATTTVKRSADLITAPSENLSGKPQEQVEKLKLPPKKIKAQALKVTVKNRVKKTQKSHKQVSEPVVENYPATLVAAATVDTPKLSSTKIPVIFKAPSSWKTVVVSPDKDKSVDFATWSATAPTYARSSETRASQEPPVEMVESIDNDGSKIARRTQSGGRSAGGAGAVSDLHSYLKLLNKRVKYFWVPPTGLDRLAIIEFRIKADGSLMRTKAMPHEGKIDEEAEAAAIAALTRAFPFLPLPADVKTGYLDVRYTFNYRFKQIQGVRNPE